MFSYEVMSEKEAMQERFQLLNEGEYDAVVKISTDRTSSSGNPMMDIILEVFDKSGKGHDIRDFLVFTKPMMWKVVHFADSAGLMRPYEDGKLCSEVAVGNRVRVKVNIEEGSEIQNDKLKGKSVGSKYPDKNKIEDYVTREQQKASSKIENDPFQDDDVAF